MPEEEELSGIGAAYTAGLSAGIYDSGVFDRMKRKDFQNQMEQKDAERCYEGWKRAVEMVRMNEKKREREETGKTNCNLKEYQLY